MTSQEIELSATSELAIRPEQTFWTDKQKAALTHLGIDKARPGDLAVFFHHCVRTGLDPFARQIYMVERKGHQTIQTGIDGFRLIARRVADARGETLEYEETLWCGKDGQWRDVWLEDQPPAAAKVTVLRNGQRYPSVALFKEYAGTTREGNITSMWATKGSLMLAKCAEALSLRKAFPQDMSGIYTSEEMQQADNVTPVSPAQQLDTKQPIPPSTFISLLQRIQNADTTQQIDEARMHAWKMYSFNEAQVEALKQAVEKRNEQFAEQVIEETANETA